MREVEKIITYELTPEEREGTTLEDAVIRNCQNGWTISSMTPKHKMPFDANYNTYYAKVKYEQEIKSAFRTT